MVDQETTGSRDSGIRDDGTTRLHDNGTECSSSSSRSRLVAKVFAATRRSQWSVVCSPWSKQRRVSSFTLVELLVTAGVVVLLVLLFTQLLNSAASITTLGHKLMDADSQARQVLDRMSIDFAQMVKRSDVDYFAKGTAAPNSVGGTMAGNDQIAFYSAVPGYYPSGSSTGSQSPVSLVAYRINSLSGATPYNKMERLGKGLVWNGVSADTPVVFMPRTIGPSPDWPSGAWPAAVSSSLADPDGSYEIIGSQVFRFEYYYLLNNGSFSGTPWNTSAGHTAVNGMQDVSAIVVDIAVIDPKSKLLLRDADIVTFTTSGAANFLSDYASGMVPGQLRAQWQNTLNGITSLPRPAISGIRVYERYFYLSTPTLLTP
jgi:hypothetical protein